MLKYITLATLSAILSFAAISPRVFQDDSRKLVLGLGPTDWEFLNSDTIPSTAKLDDLPLQFVARGKTEVSGFQPTLSMRIDKSKWNSASDYANHWLKEFPKFGFELRLSQNSKYGHLNGYDIELKSLLSNRRIRQFIVQRSTEVWIFTCSGEEQNFWDTWKVCRQILSTSQLKGL